jgi:hypothetical protein
MSYGLETTTIIVTSLYRLLGITWYPGYITGLVDPTFSDYDEEPRESHTSLNNVGRCTQNFTHTSRDGLLKNARDQTFPRSREEAQSVKWLLDSRGAIGTYSWEKLIGDENFIVMNVLGNHFSVIREPDVSFHPHESRTQHVLT